MTLFEPLFLVSVLALFLSSIRVVYLLARRRPVGALVSRVVACVAAYFAALVTVSLVSPARIYAPGEPQCFDDWCLAVTRVEAERELLRMHVNVIGQARRVVQQEIGVQLTLADDGGRVYRPVSDFGQPLDTAVAAGEHFAAGRVFRPDSHSRGLVMIIKHGGPGMFVSADRGSLLHRPSRMLLPAPTP